MWTLRYENNFHSGFLNTHGGRDCCTNQEISLAGCMLPVPTGQHLNGTLESGVTAGVLNRVPESNSNGVVTKTKNR